MLHRSKGNSAIIDLPMKDNEAYATLHATCHVKLGQMKLTEHLYCSLSKIVTELHGCESLSELVYMRYFFSRSTINFAELVIKLLKSLNGNSR